MTMLKHFLFLTLTSILLVIFKNQANAVLNFIKGLYNFLLHKLSLVFANSFSGLLIQQILAIVIICMLVALFLMLAYWLIYRTIMPHFFPILWFIWIVLLVTLTLNR